MGKTCLFVHDHMFRKFNDHYFTEGKITDSTLKNFFRENDKLYILSRYKDIDNVEKENLNQIQGKNIFFKPITGKSFLTIFSVLLPINIVKITYLVNKSDYLVVRLPSFLGIFTLTLNIFFKKKYFLEVVGDAEESLVFRNSNKNVFYTIFIDFFSKTNKFFIYNALGVVYVTQYSLQRKYPTAAKNASSISDVIIHVKKLPPVASFYLQKNPEYFTIGLIGSFNNKYKGLDVAIKAIHLLKTKGLKARLYILGSGKLIDEYKSLADQLAISELIIFDGVLAGGEAVFDWLDKLDLYIQPSKTEGLPRALLEAMSRGLPVIASDVGGIPELISNKWLIPSNDSEYLATKIEQLYFSVKLRQKVGTKNHIISSEYDYTKLSDKRESFWKKVYIQVDSIL